MTPFDGMASSFKFSQLVTQRNILSKINVPTWIYFCKKLLVDRNKGTKTVKGSLILMQITIISIRCVIPVLMNSYEKSMKKILGIRV